MPRAPLEQGAGARRGPRCCQPCRQQTPRHAPSEIAATTVEPGRNYRVRRAAGQGRRKNSRPKPPGKRRRVIAHGEGGTARCSERAPAWSLSSKAVEGRKRPGDASVVRKMQISQNVNCPLRVNSVWGVARAKRAAEENGLAPPFGQLDAALALGERAPAATAASCRIRNTRYAVRIRGHEEMSVTPVSLNTQRGMRCSARWAKQRKNFARR